MLGKIEGGRRRGQQRMRWLGGITDPMDMSLSKLQELVIDRGLACCSPRGHRVGHDRATKLNWEPYYMKQPIFSDNIWVVYITQNLSSLPRKN